jgi:hypothetical protein
MGGTLDEKFEKLLERQKKKKEDSGLRSIPHSDIQGLLNAAVDRLSIVSINVLDDSDDVVAEVFDALNGKRLELSQFDHLRNHCFRKIDVGVRDKVYDDHWVPAEKNIFGVGSVKRPADHFLYNYLISVGEGARSQFNQRRAFGAFRRYERSAMRSSVEKWISGELGDAVSRWRFALHPVGKLKARGRDIKLNDVSRAAMARIRMVSEGPPLPLVMVMLDRVSRLDPKSDPESITTREFKKLVIALEGCLFKTRLAGDSLTNLRADVMKRLPALLREWKSDPVEGKSAGDKMFEWIQEKSPPWSQVESFMTSDWKHHPPSKPQGAYSLLLSGPSLALFDALEEQKSGAGGSALFHRYTDPLSKANESDAPFWVEHLYPQKPHNDWSADLATWKCDESEMRKQLHRLGNLAPIGASLNRKMRNKRFSSKTDDAKDPKMPRLKVNGGWEKSKSWTTKQINQREKFLLKIMKERWPE